MSWIAVEQIKLVKEKDARIQEYKDKSVTLPEYSKLSVFIRVDKFPNVKIVESKKKPGQKFNVYEFDTADGKVLSCFDGLYSEIINALNEYSDKIEKEKTEFVNIEIHNKADLKKPNWFVVVKAGV